MAGCEGGRWAHRCSSCGCGRPCNHAATWGSRTVKVPQSKFIAPSEDIPVASRSSTSLSWRKGSFPWYSKPLRFSSCSTLTRCSMFVVQGQQVRVQSVRRQSRSHSCSSSNSGQGCCMPVCNDTCPCDHAASFGSRGRYFRFSSSAESVDLPVRNRGVLGFQQWWLWR